MPDAPRLFLITPPLTEATSFAPLLRAALEAADVACVLIRVAGADDHLRREIVKALSPIVQQAGAAALIENDARLAVRLGVDGVHVSMDEDAAGDALQALKPDRIVGVGGILGRDAAMSLGEAGVDYLMFGQPGTPTDADVIDRIGWWASLFNVPCVGYVDDPARAGEVAAADAEFVALCDGLWDAPAGIATVLKTVTAAIQPVAEAAS